MFNKNYKVFVPQKNDWVTNQIRINYNSHVYFTDGSVKRDSSGYGALYMRDHSIIKGQCGKYANTTQTELTAIHACCIHAIKHELTGPICIYSDSLGALNALKSCTVNSRLALECVLLLEKLAQGGEISVIWLPAHSGIYGNEVADKIAKYAATEVAYGPEPLLAIERSIIKKTNDTWLKEQTMLVWRGTQGLEHTKCFIDETSFAISEQLIEMSKRDIRITIGLITGHCKLNQHLMRLGIRNDPDCDLCGRDRETAEHFLCKCESLKNIRKKHFANSILDPRELCKNNLPKIVKYYKDCSTRYQHISRIFQ